VLKNFYFCGTHDDADCVVNKVDGKIIGERWFEEDLEESGRGLIGVTS
jgi:phage terminase large subunit